MTVETADVSRLESGPQAGIEIVRQFNITSRTRRTRCLASNTAGICLLQMFNQPGNVARRSMLYHGFCTRPWPYLSL